MAEANLLFDYTGHLPECPTWSDAEQALYWADIMECEIHRYVPATGDHQILQFPEEVGCFALREKGALSSRYAAQSGLPIAAVCSSIKSAITQAIHSWRALMTAAPIAMDVFMPVPSGAG